MRPVLAARSLLVALGVSLAVLVSAATITVTITNDSGAGSLRDAIDASNASVGTLDTIAFSIPGAGVHTITLTTSPPTVTDPVTIDGSPPLYCPDNSSTRGQMAVFIVKTFNLQ